MRHPRPVHPCARGIAHPPPVRLPSGSLAVFSPTALIPRVRDTLASLGTVKYLVAPDIEHHIQLGAWHAAFPTAVVLGPDGLPEKRAQSGEDKVPFTHVYTPSNRHDLSVDAEFDAAFDVAYVAEHGNRELVFHHKPDRTLIQADLIFNNPPIEQYSKSPEDPHAGIATKLFHALTGTSGAALQRQRRFIWYAMSSGNRDGFNQAVKKIEAWDFDRIIPCHGDVIETGGKGVFRSVMQWHLQAAGVKF